MRAQCRFPLKTTHAANRRCSPGARKAAPHNSQSQLSKLPPPICRRWSGNHQFPFSKLLEVRLLLLRFMMHLGDLRPRVALRVLSVLETILAGAVEFIAYLIRRLLERDVLFHHLPTSLLRPRERIVGSLGQELLALHPAQRAAVRNRNHCSEPNQTSSQDQASIPCEAGLLRRSLHIELRQRWMGSPVQVSCTNAHNLEADMCHAPTCCGMDHRAARECL